MKTSRRNKKGSPKFRPHYSGDLSHKFWDFVNSLKGKDLDAAYSMGVMLQNLEGAVLLFLNTKKPQRKNPFPMEDGFRSKARKAEN